MTAPAASAWLVVALVAGCVAPPAGGPEQVEVGGGRDVFESLVDGQDVDMIEGAQGGWHLWISVRTEFMEPHGIHLEVQRAPADTMRPLQTSLHTLDLQFGEAGYQVTGLLGVMSQPECFQDREVLVHVTAEDIDGRIAEDQRLVVPRWPVDIGDCN